MSGMVLALFFTLLIEIPIVIKLVPYNQKAVTLTVLGVNLLTNPLLNFLMLYLRSNSFVVNFRELLVFELGVLLIEASIYQIKFKISLKYAVFVSTIANLTSFVGGVALSKVLPFI